MRTFSKITFILLMGLPLLAQVFTSGSNGSDGAYSPTQSGDFDPVALGIDVDGDNVFHFTSVNIPAGVTIRLKAWKMRRPTSAYFLATGNVTIAGTLDLSGENGSTLSSDTSDRRLSQPGPGGYPGGSGGKFGDTTPRRGFGPGAALWPCFPAYADVPSHTPGPPACTQPGITYANSMLLPLVGGSGGSGGPSESGLAGGRGGAGGGAIRIASNSLISITGGLVANAGGAPYPYQYYCTLNAIPGTGGAIHLLAPAITLTGTVSASAITPSCDNNGSTGRIRIDSSNLNSTGATLNPTPAIGPLASLPVPTNLPSLRFVSIGGVNAPTNASGSFAVPDVVINSGGAPTSVQIGASGIPIGTTLTLIIEAQGSALDQTVTTSALAGSLASSTASASVTFPAGLQRLYLRVVW